jgi:hypothetical protein
VVRQEQQDVPESKSRKKAVYVAPPEKAKAKKPNPPWFVPVMVGLMVAGLAWIVVTYLSQSKYPIPGIGAANLAIGFVLIMAGFGMTTRWR